jgi:hypothetical protein
MESVLHGLLGAAVGGAIAVGVWLVVVQVTALFSKKEEVAEEVADSN